MVGGGILFSQLLQWYQVFPAWVTGLSRIGHRSFPLLW